MRSNRDVRCVLIADDLTGACDAGVQFVNRGLSCECRWEWPCSQNSQLPEVIACSTDSRGDSAEIAVAKIASLAANLSSVAPQIIFKKIDSTFRGHVAIEIKTCMELFQGDCALIAPSFPAMQRTVTGGVLQWQDCSGASAVNIGSLLRESLGEVALLPQASGMEELAASMERAIATSPYLLVDAVTQEDLARTAAAAGQLKQRVLWVGSAGLALALAELLQSRPKSECSHFTGERGPMVFCIGSDHRVTLAQEEYLLRTVEARRLDPSAASLEDARKALDEHRDLVVKIGRGMAESELRDFFLGLAGQSIAGILMTGGDTAAMICRALGVAAIQLQGEIEAGLPWGIAIGGAIDGMQVATKSGGFGAPDALVRTAEFFSSARRVSR